MFPAEGRDDQAGNTSETMKLFEVDTISPPGFPQRQRHTYTFPERLYFAESQRGKDKWAAAGLHVHDREESSAWPQKHGIGGPC